MSELRSVVESLRSETLAPLPDARIEEDFAELHRTLELLEVERLRRLAEIDRRRLCERDGHLSAASWLADGFKVAWGAARDHVPVARPRWDARDRPRFGRWGGIHVGRSGPSAGLRSRPRGVRVLGDRAGGGGTDPLDTRSAARGGLLARAGGPRGALGGQDRARARRRLHASVSFSAWCASTATSTPSRGKRC